MDRRSFLGLLPLLPLALKVSEVPVNNKFNYKPHPKQVEFYNQKDTVSLYGVPYHEHNASTGTWLGLSRSL